MTAKGNPPAGQVPKQFMINIIGTSLSESHSYEVNASGVCIYVWYVVGHTTSPFAGFTLKSYQLL